MMAAVRAKQQPSDSDPATHGVQAAVQRLDLRKDVGVLVDDGDWPQRGVVQVTREANRERTNSGVTPRG